MEGGQALRVTVALASDMMKELQKRGREKEREGKKNC